MAAQPSVGDEVLVTIKGTITNLSPVPGGHNHVKVGENVITNTPNVEVKVLTPASSPAQDPVGTLYKVGTDTRVFIKLRQNEFRSIADVNHASASYVTEDLVLFGYQVIGATPNTPAAEPVVVNYRDREPDRNKTFKEVEHGYFLVLPGWRLGLEP